MITHEDYQIVCRDQPAWDLIGGGIQEFNTRQAGDDHGRNLCFVIEAPGGEVMGGIIGTTYWNWLYIELMWIREDLRKQGFGGRLLALAEEEARGRGATHAYLDTFSFQSPGFYEKHGYRVFGTLDDFPPGHQRYFLTRLL